jgi:hypothetical protein
MSAQDHKAYAWLARFDWGRLKFTYLETAADQALFQSFRVLHLMLLRSSILPLAICSSVNALLRAKKRLARSSCVLLVCRHIQTM